MNDPTEIAVSTKKQGLTLDVYPRKVGSWADELMRWENAHPEYRPFSEDKGSQRELNAVDAY